MLLSDLCRNNSMECAKVRTTWATMQRETRIWLRVLKIQFRIIAEVEREAEKEGVQMDVSTKFGELCSGKSPKFGEWAEAGGCGG